MNNKTLVLFLFIFFTRTVFAITVPEVVQKAFHEKFPSADKIKWEKENAKELEASFILNGVKTSANYTLDGKWVATETAIPVKDLPAAVVKSVMAKYSAAVITGADKIESAAKGILYEVEFKDELKKREAVTDSEGNIQ